MPRSLPLAVALVAGAAFFLAVQPGIARNLDASATTVQDAFEQRHVFRMRANFMNFPLIDFRQGGLSEAEQRFRIDCEFAVKNAAGNRDG